MKVKFAVIPIQLSSADQQTSAECEKYGLYEEIAIRQKYSKSWPWTEVIYKGASLRVKYPASFCVLQPAVFH